jgi:hypothetical protein
MRILGSPEPLNGGSQKPGDNARIPAQPIEAAADSMTFTICEAFEM